MQAVRAWHGYNRSDANRPFRNVLLTALSCPQCGGALPKAARWLIVTCPHCGSKVSANKQVVRRADFREAHAKLWAQARARDAMEPGGLYVQIGARLVRLIAPLALGESSEVFLGQRVGPFAERYTVRIALNGDEPRAERYFAGALQALGVLHAANGGAIATAPFFTQRTPQVVALGTDYRLHGAGRAVWLTRHPPDYWGSLAQVLALNRGGIDARHVVWMYSRCLDLLGYTHACGVTHNALSLDHLLVQPHDHSMQFVGWGHACTAADGRARARDIAQLAWSMRRLVSSADPVDGAEPELRDDVPAPLAAFLRRASEDEAWLFRSNARELSELLMQAAGAAFGPRKFVHFDPRAAAPAAREK